MAPQWASTSTSSQPTLPCTNNCVHTHFFPQLLAAFTSEKPSTSDHHAEKEGPGLHRQDEGMLQSRCNRLHVPEVKRLDLEPAFAAAAAAVAGAFGGTLLNRACMATGIVSWCWHGLQHRKVVAGSPSLLAARIVASYGIVLKLSTWCLIQDRFHIIRASFSDFSCFATISRARSPAKLSLPECTNTYTTKHHIFGAHFLRMQCPKGVEPEWLFKNQKCSFH
ncbi:unnamed protein product [Durusdinium trenchii]|uniref:Uncharacterized protein n=1 Tax=Durusdinium trenchii TaxID=1381693 RepID=A0ABP0RMT7_9DINO